MNGHWPDYPDAGLDEMIRDGRLRHVSAGLLEHLMGMSEDQLLALGATRDQLQSTHDMRFTLDGQDHRLFPLDLLPRIVRDAHWQELCRGLEQRVRALNALIVDVAGEGAAVRAGVIPRAIIRSTAPLSAGLGGTPATVAGMDLLREADGTWRVLEDNLRVPSGIGYALMARRVTSAMFAEHAAAQGVSDPHSAPEVLLAALRASAPPRCSGPPRVAVLSVGPTDSAAAEHRLLAERMGVPLLTPRELTITSARLGSAEGGIDVIYRRIDDVELSAASLADGQAALPALTALSADGALRVCNALGCGVADDKAVYAFVPRLIEFYLGQRALLAEVPTFVLADPEHRERAMERLGELVVKPVDGYGGKGVTFADRLTPGELGKLRATLLADPAGWIAQEPIAASTVPTRHEDGWHPCAVDLRAFVVSSPDSVTTLPAPLTRVAARGSRIVNSSRGGGCKDTWIVPD